MYNFFVPANSQLGNPATHHKAVSFTITNTAHYRNANYMFMLYHTYIDELLEIFSFHTFLIKGDVSYSYILIYTYI